jgi:hypothetical protein
MTTTTTTTTNEWSVVDRKRKRTLDKLEYEFGLRKTLPPASAYDLTDAQRGMADNRALDIAFAIKNHTK